MNTRSTLKVVAVLGLILLVAACAGPNTVVQTPDAGGGIAGFWQGLFNGITLPFAWFVSLFNSDVQIYDVHNNGGWYNFGFILGAGVLFGGGGSSSSR